MIFKEQWVGDGRQINEYCKDAEVRSSCTERKAE